MMSDKKIKNFSNWNNMNNILMLKPLQKNFIVLQPQKDETDENMF